MPVGWTDVLARSGGQFGVSPEALPIHLVLSCDPELARRARKKSPLERRPRRSHAQADGRVRLSATLPAGWELRWWLLAPSGAARNLASRPSPAHLDAERPS